jgi:hypothetical protein
VRKIHIKLGLFLLLWHEIDAFFQWGANLSCLATLVLFFGASVVRATGIEIAGMTGPVTACLVTHLVLWLVIYFSLAPRIVFDLPISFTGALWVMVALGGAWCRSAFFVWIQDIDAQWIQDRSETTVKLLMGTLTLCCWAQIQWGSVLPLIGFVLLPGLPFSFGWLAVTPVAGFRFDAQFGAQDMFHDVGASDEF